MVLCFVADEEMFQGSQRFAEPKLRAFFNLYGEESEKKYLKNVVRQERFKIAKKKKKKRRQGKKGDKKRQGKIEQGMFYSDEDDESSEEDGNGEDQGIGLNFMSMIQKSKAAKDEKDDLA